MAVTPAGAEVSNAVATNWKKIWKKNLKPLADKRYYTKAQGDTKYATKAESAAAAAAAQAGATSAANSATDGKLGNYYTKAQGDAKYAPVEPVYRGTFSATGDTAGAGRPVSDSINWGATFSVPPTVHYMKAGDPLAVGCSGTVSNPNASPGHLCIFESLASNAGTRDVDNATGNHPLASVFGANVIVYSVAAGAVFAYGSWAARPLAVANPARVSPQQGQGARTGE